MPLENKSYRDNLERLNAAFPDKEALTKKEVAAFLGRNETTIWRRLNFLFRPGIGVTKATLARKLSEPL